MKKFFSDLGHFFKDLFYTPFTKKGGRLAVLYMLFAAALVGANCVAGFVFPLNFGFKWFGQYDDLAITVGILFYPFTFLITDIIGENYGRKAANKAVLGGFIGQVGVIIVILIIDAINKFEGGFHETFFNNWIIIVGSLIACIISQTWDVFIFHKLRDNYIKKHGSTKGGKWIWNNLSTTGSQLIDSSVFMVFFFTALGLWGKGAGYFFGSLLVYWGLKVIIALLDTPIFYLLTMGHKDRVSVTSDEEADVEVDQ